MTVKPALTAEEWEEGRMGDDRALVVTDTQARWDFNLALRNGGEAIVTYADDFYYGSAFQGEERHGLAALCLHNQPFGFTREDVEMLLEPSLSPEGQMEEREDLARRIEALLPPEDLE